MLGIKIWNRDFDLKVLYDCYVGEEILDEQKEALKKFSSDKKTIESSKVDVEKYCLDRNKDEIGGNEIDNIFKYVMPESIFVKRDLRVAIIIFKNGSFIGVDSQDSVL